MAWSFSFLLGVALIFLHAGEAAKCISTCDGIFNGNYQYCGDCHVYVMCYNGDTYIRPCPPQLEYDSKRQQCVAHSDTCKQLMTLNGIRTIIAEMDIVVDATDSVDIPPQRHCNSTGARCVKDCKGKKDGDYQSCHGCDVYVSCVDGLRYDDRPCAPGGLAWDDDKKRCEWTSPTCQGCEHHNPCAGTGPCCKRDCKGLKDGDYQSCLGCNIYLSCSNGHAYDKRPCAPGGTFWDDNKKRCDWYSNTCFHCHK